MSLKAFHVFFITVSVLLCLGFGAWCFTTRAGDRSYALMGGASFVVAAALVAYEVNFLRKYRE